MSRCIWKVRSGFTIVELLVVIAIIGMLVGLLLPAVQSAREAARRLQCMNNIRQMSLGIANYESAFRRFPGYGGEFPPRLVQFPNMRMSDKDRGVPWVVQILPQLEQVQLFDKLSQVCESTRNPVLISNEQMTYVQTCVPQYYCPSRRDAIAYPLIPQLQVIFGPKAARSDYAMNGGTATVIRGTSTVAGITLIDAAIRLDDPGFWVMGQRIKQTFIQDGLSNTMMLGEKAMQVQRKTTGTCFGDLTPMVGYHDFDDTASALVRFAARGSLYDGSDRCIACHDFGSSHPVGFNAAFCDGSIHNMSYTISKEVYRKLLSSNAGDIASLEDL